MLVNGVTLGTRDDILRCARDIYLENGLAALSMRAVASCAGVSATAIYRHFDSKEDLLWAVCLRGHEIFAGYLARGLKGKGPRERLVLTGAGYLDFALDHRAYYLIMFVAPPEQVGFARLEEKNRDEAGAAFQMLIDRVRECMDAGVLGAGDAREVALGVWAHVHGLVTLGQRMPESTWAGVPGGFRGAYQRSVDAYLAGLGPRGGPRRRAR